MADIRSSENEKTKQWIEGKAVNLILETTLYEVSSVSDDWADPMPSICPSKRRAKSYSHHYLFD